MSLFTNTDKYGAKIYLSDSNILKYEVDEDSIIIAYNIANSATSYIKLTKEDNVTKGYIYDNITVSSLEVSSTSAYLYVDSSYTYCVSNKGDFIPTSYGINAEVYDSTNGKFVGSKVYEQIGDEDDDKFYDTYWFNLYDIDGINSIKKEDKLNRPNPDTIYFNGVTTDTIHSGVVSVINWSRPHDIEFKEVYAYVINEDEEYESIKFEVPLMFVQEDFLDNFETSYYSKNKKTIEKDSLNLNVSDDNIDAIDTAYTTIRETYSFIRSSITKDNIIEFCNK